MHLFCEILWKKFIKKTLHTISLQTLLNLKFRRSVKPPSRSRSTFHQRPLYSYLEPGSSSLSTPEFTNESFDPLITESEAAELAEIGLGKANGRQREAETLWCWSGDGL